MISTSNDFAAALFMLAMEEDRLDEFYSDLIKVRDIFAENPDYTLLLSSPGIPKHERVEVIDAAFGKELCEPVLNFLKVLCEHNKAASLYDCVKVFGELRKQAENKVTAHIKTAVPLDEDQLARLKSILEKKLGSKVKMKPAIDKTMLGGIKIEFEDKVIDGSLDKQLSDIKEVISG